MSLSSLLPISFSDSNYSVVEAPSIQTEESSIQTKENNLKNKKGSLILRGEDEGELIELCRNNRITTSTGMVRIQYDTIIKSFFVGSRIRLWNEFQQGDTVDNTKERFKRIVKVLIEKNETGKIISKSTSDDSKEIADSSHGSLDLTTDELRELKEVCKRHTLLTETNRPRRRIQKIVEEFFIDERRKLWDKYRKPEESDASLHRRFTCFINNLFTRYDLPSSSSTSSSTSSSLASIEEILTSGKADKKKKSIVLSSVDKEELIKICKQHRKLNTSGVVRNSFKAVRADFFKDRPNLWKLFKSETESDSQAMRNFQNYIYNHNIAESHTTPDAAVKSQSKKSTDVKPKLKKGRPKNSNSNSDLLGKVDQIILVDLVNNCRTKKEKTIQVDWQKVKSQFFVGKKEKLWKHFKKAGDEPGQDLIRFVRFARSIIKKVGSELPGKRMDIQTNQASVEQTESMPIASRSANTASSNKRPRINNSSDSEKEPESSNKISSNKRPRTNKSSDSLSSDS